MRRFLAILAVAVTTLAPVTATAQTVGPSVSISIVEPKNQSKWGYAPGTRKVAPGTWVTWSNAGQDPHTVTADDGSFDSANLDPSEGFSWFFDQPGTFHYTCTLHPWMTGTIVVTADAASPPPEDTALPAADTSTPDAE